jgi:hypothetical protein
MVCVDGAGASPTGVYYKDSVVNCNDNTCNKRWRKSLDLFAISEVPVVFAD